jgi:hypothetical protein
MMVVSFPTAQDANVSVHVVKRDNGLELALAVSDPVTDKAVCVILNESEINKLSESINFALEYC